jgi:Flp pilus assembly pilin Flp
MTLKLLRAFLTEESGQDLVEYCLLLAFIALVGAGVYIGMGSMTSGIWSIANNRVAAANN